MSYNIPYMWTLTRNHTNELTYKTERDSQTQKMNLLLLGERDSQQVWDGHVHTVIFKMDNQQGPLGPWNQGSIQNSAQGYVAAWMGGDLGAEWICVYIRLSPFIVHLKLSQHCQSAIPQYKIKISKKKKKRKDMPTSQPLVPMNVTLLGKSIF